MIYHLFDFLAHLIQYLFTEECPGDSWFLKLFTRRKPTTLGKEVKWLSPSHFQMIASKRSSVFQVGRQLPEEEPNVFLSIFYFHFDLPQKILAMFVSETLHIKHH